MKYALPMLLCLTIFTTLLRGEDFKPDNDGFIRDWLILAPIALPGENGGSEGIDAEQIKGEGKQTPKAGDKVKVNDKELTWKQVQSKDYFFDVNEILGAQTEDSVAYLVCYLVADIDMKDVQLSMGSNDQGKVYLNEKEAVKFTEGRTLERDSNTAEHLTLKSGVNLVVFKVINEKNNWQGCLRFKKSDGSPIKNLVVKTAP